MTLKKDAKKKKENPDEISTRSKDRFKIELTKPQKEVVNFLRQNKVTLKHRVIY